MNMNAKIILIFVTLQSDECPLVGKNGTRLIN